MANVAIVFHSGYGHTKAVAESVQKGAASVAGSNVTLVSVTDAEQHWDTLAKADAIIFGAPTYMGSVSADMKKFMEASSKVWFTQGWKDKLAAGFTVGATFGGNKDHTLGSMWVLSMQHGMLWAGSGVPNAQINRNTDAGTNVPNRIGSALGVVPQADNAAPDVAPPEGDREFARLLGERIAKLAAKLK